MRRVPMVGALLLVAVSLACGQEPAADGGAGLPEPTVRDSAGVRVVENGPLPTGLWRVGAEPRFTVGWASDDPTLTWIQSGRILADGGAVIGDSGPGEIHRLGPDGSVLETLGGRGEGPGEYERIEALLARGDSILVSDGRLGRVTVLAPDGAVRTVRLLAETFLHHASAILDDSRLLLVPAEGYGAVDETRPEWVFERQPILSMDLGAGTVDTLANLPHLRRWYGTRAASPGPIQLTGRAAGFSRGFAWARSDEAEVQWFDEGGDLLQVARWEEEPDPVTPELTQRLARVYEESFRSRDADEAFISAQLARFWRRSSTGTRGRSRTGATSWSTDWATRGFATTPRWRGTVRRRGGWSRATGRRSAGSSCPSSSPCSTSPTTGSSPFASMTWTYPPS